MAAHKTTTPLTKMSLETVEGDPKRQDVKNMADQYALPVEQNDGRTPSQDRSKELLPMQTRRFRIALYEMKAERSGTMWSVAPVSATTSRSPSTNASGEMAWCNADTSPGGRMISSGEGSVSDRDKGSDSRDTREQDGEDELGDGRD